MNRRNLTLLFAITVLGLGTLSGPTLAQQKSLKDQIVGTWTFVSAIDVHPDGRKGDRWGTNATGVFIFDGNGRYAQFISRSDIPKIAGNSPTKATDAENRRILENMVATFGTYTVNESEKMVITRPDGGIYPNGIGVEQKRMITLLTTDELKYTNPATSTGTQAQATWRRAK